MQGAGSRKAGKLVTPGSADNKDTITRYNLSRRVYCTKPTTRQHGKNDGPTCSPATPKIRVQCLCEAVLHFIQLLASGARVTTRLQPAQGFCRHFLAQPAQLTRPTAHIIRCGSSRHSLWPFVRPPWVLVRLAPLGRALLGLLPLVQPAITMRGRNASPRYHDLLGILLLIQPASTGKTLSVTPTMVPTTRKPAASLVQQPDSPRFHVLPHLPDSTPRVKCANGRRPSCIT
ncbi:hypothetical protein NDU88_006574 [Pleurodeles waltl]|uniref:Uncharacterized protein n=1 Tax=Pleurodeles waltl TaxID=8319 RepID=A0AAV7MGA6_PLEWA|nr:hypothetical protein NDU88_006574 [Pleurodeles waltl]